MCNITASIEQSGLVQEHKLCAQIARNRSLNMSNHNARFSSDKVSIAPPMIIRQAKTRLPPNFTPSPYSVLIGRGKRCTESVGTRRLRVVVSLHLQEYKTASTRIEKSAVVTKIVDTVQGACPVGAFVKYEGGHWWEVSDSIAREKVGAVLRDALHEQYKSSTKAKLASRRKRRLDSMETENCLSSGVQQQKEEGPDDEEFHMVLPALDFHSSLSSLASPFPEPSNEVLVMGNSRANSNDAIPRSRSLSSEYQNLKQKKKGQLERYSLKEAVSDLSNLSPTANGRRTERTLSAPSLSGPTQSVEGAWHNSFPIYHNKKDISNDDGCTPYFEDDLFAFKDIS